MQNNITPQEIQIELENQTICAKAWHANDLANNSNKLTIIALHGWLDNAASFDLIAPLLANFNLIAIDLPGHGLSSHKPKGTVLHVIDFVIDLFHIAKKLGLEKFALLGHSLGAAVASIAAGTMPHKICALGLIDGLGPFSVSAKNAPAQLCSHIKSHFKAGSSKPIYQSIEAAIQARLKASPMLQKSCELIVTRNLKAVDNNQFTWRTDPRLLKPSALSFTENQVIAFLSNISAPSLLIRPEPGFAFDESLFEPRVNAINDLTIKRVAGDHHVHLDSPNLIAPILQDFFQKAQNRL